MIVYVNTHDVLSTPMTSTIGPCCQRGTFSFFWWRPWPLPPSCTKRSMSTKWLLASALPNCWKLFELTWGPGWPQAASSWPGLIYLPCIICLSFAYHLPIIFLSFAYHLPIMFINQTVANTPSSWPPHAPRPCTPDHPWRSYQHPPGSNPWIQKDISYDRWVIHGPLCYGWLFKKKVTEVGYGWSSYRVRTIFSSVPTC